MYEREGGTVYTCGKEDVARCMREGGRDEGGMWSRAKGAVKVCAWDTCIA